MQLTGTGEGTAVICDVPGQLESWVHVVWRRSSEVNNTEWNMTFGYPLSHSGIEEVLVERGIELPEGSRIASWTASIYASVILPAQVSPAQVAELIEQIMVHLQGVTHRSDVEVALEME
jgi:hypothetical protein